MFVLKKWSILRLARQSFVTHISRRMKCWSTCLGCAYKTNGCSMNFKMQSIANIENTHQTEMLKSVSHCPCAAKSFSGYVDGGDEVIGGTTNHCKTVGKPYICIDRT